MTMNQQNNEWVQWKIVTEANKDKEETRIGLIMVVMMPGQIEVAEVIREVSLKIVGGLSHIRNSTTVDAKDTKTIIKKIKGDLVAMMIDEIMITGETRIIEEVKEVATKVNTLINREEVAIEVSARR